MANILSSVQSFQFPPFLLLNNQMLLQVSIKLKQETIDTIT